MFSDVLTLTQQAQNDYVGKLSTSRVGSAFGDVRKKSGVVWTSDFDRILNLPRRTWETEVESYRLRLTNALRQPNSTAELKPVQAAALWEMHHASGLFAPIGVGKGKTLITFLAPWFLGAKRPLLIVPSKLEKKTERERNFYLQMFRLPNNLHVCSYEKLSSAKNANFLESLHPDAIICDEAHKFKNPNAKCTKKFRRYMDACPNTMLVALTGSPSKRSIKDYHHLVEYALKGGVPLPTRWTEIELWASALDEKVREDKRANFGALSALADPIEFREAKGDYALELSAVRRGYRQRLIETRGVVASKEDPVDASIVVSDIQAKHSQDTSKAFENLRASWALPDGWQLEDGPSVWRAARQLALGFYYIWNPRPPEHWLTARKNWNAFCRESIKRPVGGMHFDSDLEVANAVKKGILDGTAYYAWVAVRDTFVPNTEAVWVDDGPINQIISWGNKNKRGLIWVEHLELGYELQRRTDWRYYHSQGIDKASKVYIEDHETNDPCIVGLEANAEGRNLQHKFYKNLLTAPPPNNLKMEQIIGRCHRDGQKEEMVFYDFLCGCIENYADFRKSVNDAIYNEDTMNEQKLKLADLNVSDHYANLTGPQWSKE